MLAVVLVVRLNRHGPRAVARRGRWAVTSLAVAVAAKAVLISQVNPQFRREDIALEHVSSLAVQWGAINGVAIVASPWRCTC